MVYRSGFAALVGRPNVGKSTLLNSLAGEKVAIVSACPQTTRNRIRGVVSRPEGQVVFVDTPGLHRPKHLLGKTMVRSAEAVLGEVDLVCFVVEANLAPGPGDKHIAGLLETASCPIILVLNKIDLATPAALQSNSGLYRDLVGCVASFPVTALQASSLEPLLQEVLHRMPEGPRYYPPGMITDQPEAFIVAEIIREKIIPLTRQEIPFSVAVVTGEISERSGGGILDIRAEIYVERKSQVGIVVGRGGLLLKEAGIAARKELETFFGKQVYLDLRVKVRRDWRSHEEELRRLGYFTRD